MIVFLSGMSRHGKDTVGSVFTDNGFTRIAFADKVKDIYCEQKNITREELEENKSLHRAGIIALAEGDLKKKHGEDYWVRLVEKDIIKLLDEGKDVVVTDVRQWYEFKFANEIMEKYENSTTLNIVRPTSNEGVFDTDKNTALGLSYAMYNQIIKMMIFNTGSEEELKEHIRSIFF